MIPNIRIKTPGSRDVFQKTAPEVTPGQCIPLKHEDRIKYLIALTKVDSINTSTLSGLLKFLAISCNKSYIMSVKCYMIHTFGD